MTHTVTAPLVVVKDERGADQYLYAGTTVPSYVGGDRVKQLEAEGFITKAADPEPEKPAYDPSQGAPAKSGSKADWETYARFKGATDADLDGKTRDDLAATYGEQSS